MRATVLGRGREPEGIARGGAGALGVDATSRSHAPEIGSGSSRRWTCSSTTLSVTVAEPSAWTRARRTAVSCWRSRTWVGGFPPEFLPHAFERFSRADQARSRGGAGLGLAIVDAIARAHGGTAQAENLAFGGVEVWLSLPSRLNDGDASGGDSRDVG